MAWIFGQLVELRHGAERRGRARVKLCLDLPSPATPNGLVRVLDLSQAGMMIHCEQTLEPGETLLVELPEEGTVKATIMWRRFTLMGCRFSKPLSRAAMAAMLLRAHPAPPPAD
jgi:hypothetical protein